ncbi:MAG: beta strand repeat-containing protein [Phenylobacterium sp.]
MPVFTGTVGPDTLAGTVGDDQIQGLDGDDRLSDTLGGNDQLSGGAGNDQLTVSHQTGVSSATVDAGAGDDTVFILGPSVFTSPTSATGLLNVTVAGGDGADNIEVFQRVAGVVDGGSGDDTISVDIFETQGLSVTLGGGVDHLAFEELGFNKITHLVTVTDFQTGAGGDVISGLPPFAYWDGGNPFAEGYLRLVDGPGGATLQYDQDGGGDSFVSIATFSSVAASQFTAANFAGVDPHAAAPSGQVINGSNVFANGSGNENITGSNGPDTIHGMLLNDQIHGGAGNDLIDGGAGDDNITGDAGADTVTGGVGNDTISGGDGDQIQGQDGADVLSTDTYFNISARVVLDGGAGNDSLAAHSLSAGQAATLLGGDGDDLIDVTSPGGTAVVDGGSGADTVQLGEAGPSTTVTLGTGSDAIYLTPGAFGTPTATVTDFAAGAGGDRLLIFDFLKSVDPSWNTTTNPFDAGLVRLEAVGGATVVQLLVGGVFEDSLTLQGVSPGSLTAANFNGYSPSGGGSQGSSFVGTPQADTLTGSTGADSISGGGGDDSLNGGLGDDTLDGGAGNDSLDGGGGVDLLHGSDGNDVLNASNGAGGQFFGDGGDDRVFVGLQGGSALLDGGDGADLLTGQGGFPASGVFTINGGNGDDQISLFNGSGVLDAGAGQDQVIVGGDLGTVTVTLGAGDDLLRVEGFQAFFSGNTASYGEVTVTDFTAGDRIDLNLFEQGHSSPAFPSFLIGTMRLAQVGADAVAQFSPDGLGDDWTTFLDLKNFDVHGLTQAVLGENPLFQFSLGGAGADTLSASAAFEAIDGGAGADSLTGDAAANRLAGGAGDDTVMAGGGADTVSDFGGSNYLRGEDGDDSIQGGAGFDDINGNKGQDTIDGGSGGHDWLVGGQGDDLITGQQADILWGNLGNDTLHGGSTAAQLRGGQGDDSITGGSGSEFISGDRGNDTESGGGGADNFHGSQDAGIDKVLDFNQAEGDRVELDPGTTYTVSQVGADTVIDMGGGNQMILVGVQLSALKDGWIFEG